MHGASRTLIAVTLVACMALPAWAPSPGMIAAPQFVFTFAPLDFAKRLLLDTPESNEVRPAGCTHYASPTGTGDGLSQLTPFEIANFWSPAKPGNTLCLLDGLYTGSSSMIDPPHNLSGHSGNPITIRALNDGHVLIDGQSARGPVVLRTNNWFVVEGINACCSNRSVVSLSDSNNIIVRRVAAWDAADGNFNIFGVHAGKETLLEDVAGWGIARKVFSSSQGGNYTTIRRAWGRWEGSHVGGPKMTYTLAYNNYNMIIENSIGTWSGERMKEEYVLLEYDGTVWTRAGGGCCGGIYSHYRVHQPYAIFGMDRLDADKNANARLLGNIAYLQSKDRFHPEGLFFVTKMDSFEVTDSVAYIEPGSHSDKKTFRLYNLSGSSRSGTSRNLKARNLIAIGGNGAVISPDWKPEGITEKASIAKDGQIFKSNRGICYRYHNGQLTKEPLWPWPMDQRIRQAMIQSGRAPVDVTRAIEGMFGPIPRECLRDGSHITPQP